MATLIAIDPSLRATGVAVFSHEGQLWRCGLARVPTGRGPGSWRAAVAGTRSYLAGYDGTVRAVVEIPQADSRSRRVRLADLFELAAVAGALSCEFHDTRGVTPSDWKGNAPKEVTAARAREALDPDELEVVAGMAERTPASLQHNVWDAIALGLWALGRLPGATKRRKA